MGIDLAFIWHPLCLISPANGIQDPFGCISAGVGSTSFIAELHDSSHKRNDVRFCEQCFSGCSEPSCREQRHGDFGRNGCKFYKGQDFVGGFSDETRPHDLHIRSDR